MASLTVPNGCKEISPTYISTDLLSPDYKERIANPLKGISRVSPPVLGGKTWGENLTSYGGIGGLPFLGKYRVKDLDVVRRHHHYSSGLSTYETKIQPYRLTTLRLSDCRMNDQLVPPPFKVYLDPAKLPIQSGVPINPYFSHKCIHEILPTNDPKRKNSNAMNVLNDRTSNVLTDYYKYLYETARFNQIYPDHFQPQKNEHILKSALPTINSQITVPDMQQRSSNITPLLAQLSLISKNQPILGSPLLTFLLDHVYNRGETAVEDLYRVVRMLWLFAESDTARQLQISLNEYPLQKLRDVIESRATINEKVDQFKTILLEFHQKLLEAPYKPLNNMHKEPKRLLRRERPVSALKTNGNKQISPKWPPSKCYTLDHKRMKLRSIDIPQHSNTDKKLPLPKGVKTLNEDTFVQTANCNTEDIWDGLLPQEKNDFGLATYKTYLKDIVPVQFDNRDIEGQDKMCMLGRQWQGSNDITLKPAGEFVGMQLERKTQLPPLSLADCLPKCGNRIQDRLGLQFKAEAHKRFHNQFPDDVPDLRDNIRSTKRRVFFYGHHSSSFRG